MKEIKLIELHLKDFKGGTLSYIPDGDNSNVFGDNATGKTRLMDAFNWLLFGKDSLGRSDFEIKTLEKDGTAVTGIEHSVEGLLSFSDSKMFPTIRLKRIYKEIWTKKRGQAKETYTGNTTKYYIDGVPTKTKKEFTDRVAEIAGDEATFWLLTSPTVFPGLHWEKQRKLLMDICGDVPDESVIASDTALDPLRDILTDRTLEDHRKVIKARKTELNKAIGEIPTRIDEVHRGMPDVSGLDLGKIESDHTNTEEALADLNLKKQGIDTGGDIAGLSKELAIVCADMQKIVSDHSKAHNETMTSLNTVISGTKNKLNESNNELRGLEENIVLSEKAVERIEKDLEGIRAEWKRVNALEFQDTTETACAACGQDLPADKVEDARTVAKASFNKKKADDIKSIDATGHERKAEKENHLKKIEANKETCEAVLYGLDVITGTLEQLERDIEALATKEEAYNTMPAYADLKGKEATIEVKIATAKAGVSGDTESLQEEIDKLEETLKLLKEGRDSFDKRTSGEIRITELKGEEKTLATEFEKIEAELFLTEQFIKTKVEMLNEKINSNFEITRFKLFNTLVDGGVVDCCEITVDGVPFNSGLNSAAQTNAGLDVCKTLMGHYGLKAPVFVDNAESVSELVDMDTQVIRLVVSEPDKKLRIEKGG